jgi:hypothetical protein
VAIRASRPFAQVTRARSLKTVIDSALWLSALPRSPRGLDRFVVRGCSVTLVVVPSSLSSEEDRRRDGHDGHYHGADDSGQLQPLREGLAGSVEQRGSKLVG